MTIPDVQASFEKTATLPGASQTNQLTIDKNQSDKNLQTSTVPSIPRLKRRLNELNDEIINFTRVYCPKTELVEITELDQRLDAIFESQKMNDAFSTLRVKMEHDYRLENQNAKKNMSYDYKSKENMDGKEEEPSSEDDNAYDNRMYFDDTDNIVSAENIRKTYKHIFLSSEYRKAVESLKQTIDDVKI